MSREKGLRTSLESRGGGGGVASSRKRGFPRAVLVPSVKPWLLLNETTKVLEGGHNIGDLWPCHQGAYRLAQAKEDLVLGKVTHWAGAEEARTSSASNPTLIPAKKGQRYVDLETTGAFEELDFQEGQFRVTGGAASITGFTLDISYNSRSYWSNEISGYDGDDARYITRVHFADPLIINLDADTDWHLQGNMFACQRQSLLDDQNTDHPRLNTGLPVVPVEADEYFWLKVAGTATGQLMEPISETDVNETYTDLYPWRGHGNRGYLEDVGKLQKSTGGNWAPFAKLLTRSIPGNGFARDSYVPIWLYGETAS